MKTSEQIDWTLEFQVEKAMNIELNSPHKILIFFFVIYKNI